MDGIGGGILYEIYSMSSQGEGMYYGLVNPAIYMRLRYFSYLKSGKEQDANNDIHGGTFL